MFFTWEDIGKGNNSVHQYRTANYDPTNVSAVHFLMHSRYIYDRKEL